jgi:CelD/BcsL family acetyltransferase involved in cellulose biosynthesis
MMLDVSHECRFKITLFSDFGEIEPFWRRFEAAAECYAYQTFDWLSNWYNIMGKKYLQELCLILVETTDARPVMLLPMGFMRGLFISRLIWLGGVISDYHGPLLDKESAQNLSADDFRVIWAEVENKLPKHDVNDLDTQPEYIYGLRNPFMQLNNISHASNAHFTRLYGPINEFIIDKRGSKQSKSLNKKQRHLERTGKLEFVIVNEDEPINRVLSELMAQKSASYAEMGVPDLFRQECYRDFLMYMAKKFSRDSFVQLCALMLDDRLIAAHWGLIYRNRMYFLFPSYTRSDIRRYSPGMLLFCRMFEWGIEHEMEVCDFTMGDEPFKYDWCDQELKLYDHLSAKTVQGFLYVFIEKKRRLLKRKVKQSHKLFSFSKKIRKLVTRLHIL